MKRDVFARVHELWDRFLHFREVKEAYGAFRDLAEIASLIPLMPANQQAEWNGRLMTIELQEFELTAIRQEASERRERLWRIVSSSGQFLDEEIILVISSRDILSQIDKFMRQCFNADIGINLDSIEQEIEDLKKDKKFLVAYRRCEATVRRNSCIYLT